MKSSEMEIMKADKNANTSEHCLTQLKISTEETTFHDGL